MPQNNLITCFIQGFAFSENEYDLPDVIFAATEKVMESNSMENLFFTFGIDHPGAMALHNYPKFLTNLNLPKSSPHGKGPVDMATIDVLRDRERGIPRYVIMMFRKTVSKPLWLPLCGLDAKYAHRSALII